MQKTDLHEILGNPYENFRFQDYAQDITGWNSSAPIFRELIEAVRPDRIVELGTWKGASAIHMAKICRELDLQTKIYCVDTWLGNANDYKQGVFTMAEKSLNRRFGYPQLYYQFLANVCYEGLQDYILPFPMTTNGAFEVFQSYDMKFDLIYIDGAHDEDSVYIDLWNYDQLLKSTGVLFGDDYDHLGVANALQNYIVGPRELQVEPDGIKWRLLDI